MRNLAGLTTLRKPQKGDYAKDGREGAALIAGKRTWQPGSRGGRDIRLWRDDMLHHMTRHFTSK